MKPQAYMIALLAVVIVQAAPSIDTEKPLEIQSTLLDGVKDVVAKLTGRKDPETFTKSLVNAENQTPRPLLNIPDDKYQKSLVIQSANKLWTSVRQSPYVPKWFIKLVDSISLGQDLNNQKVQDFIDTSIKKAIAKLPLSENAKTHIESITKSITNKTINSTLFVRGIETVRLMAQAGTVGLSLATALALGIGNEVLGVDHSPNSIITAAPPIIKNVGDYLQTELKELKSGLDHNTDLHGKQSSDEKWDDLDSINELSQTDEEHLMKKVAYYLTNFIHGVKPNNQLASEPVNQLQTPIQHPIKTIQKLIQPNDQASQPVHRHNVPQIHHKLVPVGYHQVQSNYQDPVYHPAGQESYQQALGIVHHKPKHHNQIHKSHFKIVQPSFESAQRENDDNNMGVVSVDNGASVKATAQA